MVRRKSTRKWVHDYPSPSTNPKTKILAWKKAKKSKFKTFVWQGTRYTVGNYKINKKTGMLNKK